MYKLAGRPCLTSEFYYNNNKPKSFCVDRLRLDPNITTSFLYNSQTIELNAHESNAFLAILHYYFTSTVEEPIVINVIVSFLSQHYSIPIQYVESYYCNDSGIAEEQALEMFFTNGALRLIVGSKQHCQDLFGDLCEKYKIY